MQKKHYLLSFAISGLIIAGGFYSIAAGPSSSVASANPYDEETLVVAENTSQAQHEDTAVITNSLEYWSENSEQYAGYPIDYDYQPNSSDPDVEIIWVENLDSCDDVSDPEIAGCADYVETSAPGTVTVHMETGHDRGVTEEVLKHELGHTLGLTHDDEPEEIMGETK